MSKMIDVAVACGTNSEAYAGFLIWSMSETSDISKFRFLFGINHDDVDVSVLEKLRNDANVEVFDARSGLGYCSKSHGLTLDKIFERVTSDISMVCDVDVAFIEPGWDDLYVEKLNEGHVAVGPEYARTYHLRGGHHKHLGFPNLLATMIRTRPFKEQKVSFLPDSDIMLDETNAHLYGLEPGTILRRDTGWELSPKLRQDGSTGYAMKMLSYGDAESQLLVGERQLNGNEFHMNSTPILTHMGRSSIRKLGEHPAAVLWETRVREWINARRIAHRLVNEADKR